ncbi:type II toxin-antitoxin system RelE/ParE family toxin [uncultured Roseobacter sp.]|uniref:type II toxin-antitoxin system RelE/ParE family toxin n=1 Tax=uncultured Roseobacter sp. TaxID=114847 RepID=UPI002602FF6A|nr:type II toxin-antitoxin system RelE/ParE family toxin [uncultured Roseobacter sp.]
MIRQILFRPRAIADLEDIWQYTEETWSVDQAARYLTGLDAAVALLAEFPDMARARTEFTPPVRIHPYRRHLILYLAEEESIDVLRIVHGRANWAEFLADDEEAGGTGAF